MTKINRIIFTIISLIVLALIVFYLYKTQDESIKNSKIIPISPVFYNSTKSLSEDEINKIILNFVQDQNFDRDFVTPVDFPPIARIIPEAYSCTEAGDEHLRAGKTEIIKIDNDEYCLTKVSEGAAGSTYTQYSYLKDIGGQVVSLNFSFRFVQCMNYDDIEQNMCKQEQSEFNLDSFVHNIFKKIENTK